MEQIMEMKKELGFIKSILVLMKENEELNKKNEELKNTLEGHAALMKENEEAYREGKKLMLEEAVSISPEKENQLIDAYKVDLQEMMKRVEHKMKRMNNSQKLKYLENMISRW